MLRVSIHAGPLSGISRFNRISWLDIGYERLAPIADYKVVLYANGQGARPPVTLRNYPRWSASLWDLTARAIALSLTEPATANAVPAWEPCGKRFAFATALSALIEHCPAGNQNHRRTLASAEVLQCGRARGTYTATFREDAFSDRSTEAFQFAPKFLRPAELLLHAVLMRLTGQHEAMPAFPGLALPDPYVENSVTFVPIARLVEPARTGFQRWLELRSEPPLMRKDELLGIAPETLYLKFLEETV